MTTALTIKPLAGSTIGAVVENLDVETVIGPDASPEVWGEPYTARIDMTEPRTMWPSRIEGDNESEFAALVSDSETAP